MIKFKLDELLEGQGKSMYWLSKNSGVRPNTISQWVNNEHLSEEEKVKNISADTLDKICDALGCKIEDLIEHVKTNESKGRENNEK